MWRVNPKHYTLNQVLEHQYVAWAWAAGGVGEGGWGGGGPELVGCRSFGFRVRILGLGVIPRNTLKMGLSQGMP